MSHLHLIALTIFLGVSAYSSEINEEDQNKYGRSDQALSQEEGYMAWAWRILTFGYYGQTPEEKPMVRFLFDDPQKERDWLNSLEKKGSF